MPSHESAVVGEMAIAEVMEHLPHRFPFLFVDRVLECVSGEHIRGTKLVTRMDCSPAPGSRRLAMPNLLVVEALAQVSVILVRQTLRVPPSYKPLLFFAGIEFARFRGLPRLGDNLMLTSHVRRIRKSAGWFSAVAEVDAEPLCEVNVSAAWSVG